MEATITKSLMNFFSFKAQAALICFENALIKASIFHYLNPDRYIQIETNTFNIAIDRVLSQLLLSINHVTYNYSHNHLQLNLFCQNS